MFQILMCKFYIRCNTSHTWKSFSWHCNRGPELNSHFFFKFLKKILFIYLKKILFIFKELLFNYSSSHFPPYCSLPYPPPLSKFNPHSRSPPPIVFVHESWPIPFFTPLSPSLVPSGHCQIVHFFYVTGFILLACLFCWLGSTYRWDYMVFVFYHLVYIT